MVLSFFMTSAVLWRLRGGRKKRNAYNRRLFQAHIIHFSLCWRVSSWDLFKSIALFFNIVLKFLSLIVLCRNGIIQSVNYPVDQCAEITRNPNFNAEHPIVIYVHGINTNQSSSAIKDLVESFVTYNRKFNMFTLDWDRFAYLDYFEFASLLAPVVCLSNILRNFTMKSFTLIWKLIFSTASGLVEYYIIAVRVTMELWIFRKFI